MKLSFYAACLMSLVVNAVELESHSNAMNGLTSVVETNPELDNLMFTQTDSSIEADPKAAASKVTKKQEKKDVAAAKLKAKKIKKRNH